MHGRAEMLKIIHGRMEFLFSCSTLYLAIERTVQVRYRGEHGKRSTISRSNYVMYHFVHYMNTATRSGCYSCFTKRTCVIVSIATQPPSQIITG